MDEHEALGMYSKAIYLIISAMEGTKLSSRFEMCTAKEKLSEAVSDIEALRAKMLDEYRDDIYSIDS